VGPDDGDRKPTAKQRRTNEKDDDRKPTAKRRRATSTEEAASINSSIFATYSAGQKGEEVI
jgi:hypothetical protein